MVETETAAVVGGAPGNTERTHFGGLQAKRPSSATTYARVVSPNLYVIPSRPIRAFAARSLPTATRMLTGCRSLQPAAFARARRASVRNGMPSTTSAPADGSAAQ